MRSRFPAPAFPSEVAEFAEEIRHLLTDLGRHIGNEPLAGECAPALDVYETDEAVEIVVDVPGVEAAAIRVAAQGDTVLIVGEKIARRARAESSFHLVERDFGRFARAVRLTRACDTGRARARIANGELHISVPKIVERRRRLLPVAIG